MLSITGCSLISEIEKRNIEDAGSGVDFELIELIERQGTGVLILFVELFNIVKGVVSTG